MAPLMAMDPSLVAGTAARLPLNEPNGVRTALTITTSCGGAGGEKKKEENFNIQRKLSN